MHRSLRDSHTTGTPRRWIHRSLAPLVVAIALVAAGCGDDSNTDTGATADETGSTESTAAGEDVAPTTTEGDEEECWDPTEMLAPGQEPDAGYEIIERRDDGTMVAWMSPAITQEEFDAIELPAGWSKNQPRGGGGPDSGRLCGSPGTTDGEMVFAQHFGHEWAHVATIVEIGVPVDDEGLLLGSMIDKQHEVTYNAGSTVPVLVSPDGELYPLVSRDAGRTTDESPIPEGWRVVEHTFAADYTTRLPEPTLNIRVQNQDSYQGPVTGIEVKP